MPGAAFTECAFCMATMTDDWDFYFCNVDDKPASIDVDLGAVDMLPIKTHGSLGTSAWQ